MTGGTDARTERRGESSEGLITSLTRALGEVDRAGDIVEFSIVVVTRSNQLRNIDHSVFQQKAAV
ncbi:hypothetical protein QA641_38520 [Bradyrhizobium sp. CB1650]|uniref:hypothetical protein n=1 Tax=Bradyrhizobium sp. CB1650 TaxID=3039153 RepID=UPI002434896E|nr:hypothetical protein [Bradyrhizobium sp. CB1650]WGD51314.1 hypothetical protein QA641_38520 [Bradyrhizobium sp. CB1650]